MNFYDTMSGLKTQNLIVCKIIGMTGLAVRIQDGNWQKKSFATLFIFVSIVQK